MGRVSRAEIIDGGPEPSGIGELDLVWRDKVGHVGLRDRGRLVAHAGGLPSQLRVRDQRVLAVGLGGVLVHRSLRGRGVGARVVRGAIYRMRQPKRPSACFPKAGQERAYPQERSSTTTDVGPGSSRLV